MLPPLQLRYDKICAVNTLYQLIRQVVKVTRMINSEPTARVSSVATSWFARSVWLVILVILAWDMTVTFYRR